MQPPAVKPRLGVFGQAPAAVNYGDGRLADVAVRMGILRMQRPAVPGHVVTATPVPFILQGDNHMNTNSDTAEIAYSADALLTLSEDQLYGLIGAAQHPHGPAVDLLGDVRTKGHFQKAAMGAFFEEARPGAAVISEGRTVFAKLWHSIRKTVCDMYTSNDAVVDDKTLIDLLVAGLSALISTNPLIMVAVVIAVKVGLATLCAA